MAASLAYTNARNLARTITQQAAEQTAQTVICQVMRETSTIQQLTGLTREDAARIAEAHLFTN